VKNRYSLPTNADSLQRWAIAFATSMLYNTNVAKRLQLPVVILTSKVIVKSVCAQFASGE
jgi:hypothetical protein